jgi:hypothetical protein
VKAFEAYYSDGVDVSSHKYKDTILEAALVPVDCREGLPGF